jgi:hypothetical protein
MTDVYFNSGDLAELLFGLVLIILALYLMARRASNLSQSYRDVTRLAERARLAIEHVHASAEACSHPAWRARSLRVKGEGQALALRCFRCNAPALDRFSATLCSDGAIAVANLTGSVQILVINGVMHEIFPFEADPDLVDGELLVYVDQADLRKR